MEGRSDRIEAVAYDYDGREKELVLRCNLCGSGDTLQASTVDRYGYAQPLRLCRRCGLAFLSPRLTGGEYADFYRDVYRPLVSAYHGRRIDAETVQDEQREYADDLVPFLRASIEGTPQTILDIGGSTGVVSAAAAEAFGSSATVLDPAPDELAVAAGRGLETIAGFAEDYDPEGRTWDLVLLCQTIDHLLDVSATVSSLARMVAPDGYAFIDVLDYLIVAERRGSLEGAVKVDHPYYLTRETAIGFFDGAGLDVVAERLTEDGHRGFLLRPGIPREPDWDGLGRAAADARARLSELGAAVD